MIVVAATVLNALWQDTLLVLCVWLLLRAWPRINAATRYVVWSATLLAALAVPVATTVAFFKPAQPVVTSTAGTAHATSTNATPARTNAAPARSFVPTTRRLRRSTPPAAPIQSALRALPALPERLHVTLPMPVAIAVFAAWALLAGYALIGLLVGLLRLERFKRDALPLPIEYRDSMPQWIEANKGRRPVRLCVSEAIDVPVAVGLFDAMILIPRQLLDRLSPAEVEQISLHELAHLRRADDWSNCLQRLIVAALGWNPAALFVAQQLELEREVACDDWVLNSVHAVRPYALCLTKMAETAAWPHHAMPAPGVFTTRKQISLRIERLLGTGRDIATNLAIGPAAAAIGSVGALALLIAFVAPSVAAPAYQVAQPAAPPTTITQADTHSAVAHGTTAVSAAAKSAGPSRAKIINKTEIQREPSVALQNGALPQVKSAELPAPSKPTGLTSKATLAQSQSRIESSTAKGNDSGMDAANKGIASGMDAASSGIANGMDAASKGIASGMKMAGAGSSIAGAVEKSLSSTGVMHRIAQAGSAKSCVGCDLRGVSWPGRDLRGAHYTGSDLRGANLHGADLSDSDLNGVDFSNANLSSVSFRHAKITGCDFTNANLSGADFTGAEITGCQFKNALLPSATLRSILNTCRGCDFSHANLSGADLSGVHLTGDDFSHADLHDANFSGSVLTGADFSRARLDGANFNGATLNSCDLSGVDLSRVDLSKAKIIGMDLSKHNTPSIS